MPSIDLRKQRKLQGRTRGFRARIQHHVWLLAFLLVRLTFTNQTTLKHQEESKNEPTIDDRKEDARLSNDKNKSFLTYFNYNQDTKNESHLFTVSEGKESDSNDSKSVIATIAGSRNDKITSRDGTPNDYVRENSYKEGKVLGQDKRNYIKTNEGDSSSDAHYETINKGEEKSIHFKQNDKKINHETDTKVEGRDIANAVEYGMKALEDLIKVKEPLLYKLGLFLNENDPAAKIANFGAPRSQKAILMSQMGYATVEASKKIAESFHTSTGRQSAGIPAEIESRIELDECPLRGRPRCPPASRRYRTADGTCNNPKNPWRGSAMLPMQRFLPPVYEDGIQSVRRSVRGASLPSPRQVSIVIHRNKNQEIQSVTSMFTQWGQFIDHDVTSTVKSISFNGSIPRCCEGGGRKLLPPELLHPSCLPIEVPPTDPILNRFGIGCMEFIRSAPSTRINCELGWREQINQVTSYIDASTIYGSDIDTSDSIRTFRNGLLFYGRPVGPEPLSPPDPPGDELCRAGALSDECLQAGDGRVSENPGLIAIHTVLVRYHNKVATVLSQINPHWSDERVFQETRKIVYSAIQHITYREFLPIVLGPDVMDSFELRLLKKGYYDRYDPKINPAIANSFSTAAFRFGHSMVQNSFIRADSHHNPLPNNVSLHNEIFNFENIWSFGSTDRLLLGLSNQPAQKRDEFIADELTNHLFQFSDAVPFGMDLASINIQRGRDHGIPPYTFWRKPCGLSPIKDWRDLEHVMSISSAIRLRSLFMHVDDIDLFTAGLAEKPLRGAVVGPTFACIIAQQFSNLRKGDRFWYENEAFESSFSPAQLQQIRKLSLAQIICQTMTEVETIQPFVFLSADNFRNIRISCDSPDMKQFDLGAWAERSFEFNSISDNVDAFETEQLQKDFSDLTRLARRNKRHNLYDQHKVEEFISPLLEEQVASNSNSNLSKDSRPTNEKTLTSTEFYEYVNFPNQKTDNTHSDNVGSSQEDCTDMSKPRHTSDNYALDETLELRQNFQVIPERQYDPLNSSTTDLPSYESSILDKHNDLMISDLDNLNTIPLATKSKLRQETSTVDQNFSFNANSSVKNDLLQINVQRTKRDTKKSKTSTKRPNISTTRSKTATRLTKTTPKPNLTKTTINSFKLKYDNSNDIPKRPTFSSYSSTKPTKDKLTSNYYQIQDDYHNDVTYLLGIVPERNTKPPAVVPIQLNINIHYSPSTTTSTTEQSIVKKKRPNYSTRPQPLVATYTTSRPTYNQNDVVVITKRPSSTTPRPISITKRPKPIEYPIFLHSPAYDRPSALSTKEPTYFFDNMEYATTNGHKRPNTYDNNFIKGPQMVYRPNYDYIDDERQPIYISSSNIYDSGSTVFEDHPFSSSNRPLFVNSNKKPSYTTVYDHNDDEDDSVIVSGNKRPQTNAYKRRDPPTTDDILEAFFHKHSDENKSTNRKTSEELTPVVQINDKLDFKTRLFHLGVDKKSDHGLVQIGAVKKEVFSRESEDHIGEELMKKKRRSVKKIRILDIDVTPSEPSGQWRVFDAREEAGPIVEVPELPATIPCSYEVPKPINEFLPAI